MAQLTPQDFADIYVGFDAPVSRFDCGRKCAPLNGGQPVCCTTGDAVPVVISVAGQTSPAVTIAVR